MAIDFCKKKVVITIRGTESLKDSITDMQWKAMPMPGVDPELGWYGHEVITNTGTLLISVSLRMPSITVLTFSKRAS